jgi:peptidyl-dipeptidase A
VNSPSRSISRPALAVAALLAFAFGAAPAPAAVKSAAQQRAEAFLDLYTSAYQSLYTLSNETEWAAVTDVTPEHDAARVAANKAYAALVGDRAAIVQARALLAEEKSLEPLTVLQLRKVILLAGGFPGTIPEISARRVEAESRQSSLLDSWAFCLERKGEACVTPTTANEIDDLLIKSLDLPERRRVWEASKEIGPALKPGLVELRDLRNRVAREVGFRSFFDLQVADYGMTVEEMMTLLDSFVRDTRPLYDEIQRWTKRRLAERYGEPAPERLPAHWLPNRWAQNWPGLVESVDLDDLFRGMTAAQVVERAEAFYVSMGFPKLPPGFWEKSDLYPVPKDSARKKNTHASAWHVDLAQDVRSLMSVEPNAQWFGTAHHELGHIYYYISYTRPEVPLLLRGGANRAFHEGIGELISIASGQAPYLRQVGVLPEGKTIDPIDWLLNEALGETIPFLAFSAGTMSHWEHDLYEQELPADQFNKRWWEYVQRFQGVVPPAARGEEFCDGCTKSHVNDDPAQYYDYAIATVLKYQLHDYIARRILKQDPHSCSYYGNKEVGAFLRGILSQGQTRDWRKVLKEATGEDLSTRALVDYFRPLQEWLAKENAK